MTHPSALRPSRRGRAIAAAAIVVSLLFAAPVAAAAAPLPAAVAAPLAAAEAPADGAAQWTVAPADADGPDGRVSLRHVIDPGASAEDAVAVSNLGSTTGTFQVSAGDGRVGPDGAFDIAPGDPVEAGSWITIEGLDDGFLTLDGGETRVLPVSIAVPDGTSPGDYPAGIVVAQSAGSDGVKVTNRIGVRLHLQVAGEITSSLEVSAVTASFEPSLIPFAPGILTVTSEVANTGNVRLGVLATASAFGADRPAQGEAQEVLPGDTITITTTTRAWPVVVLAGGVTADGSGIGEDDVPPADAVSAGFSTLAISWTGLALIVLLVGLIVVLILIRRRKRRSRRSAAPATVPEPVSGATPQ